MKFSVRSLRNLVAVIALAGMLSACGGVSTTLSTYRSAESLPVGATFNIVPEITKADEESGDVASAFDQLEFDFFAQKLSDRLVAMGFQHLDGQASDAQAPDLVVTLVYDVERQRRNDPRPNHFYSFYGHFGFFHRYGSIVVIDDNDRERWEFIRKVKVKIERPRDDQDAEQMLSLTALSRGHCQHLSSVYDEMLEAIFANFYQPNGSVIRAKTKSRGPCEGMS